LVGEWQVEESCAARPEIHHRQAKTGQHNVEADGKRQAGQLPARLGNFSIAAVARR